MARRLPAPGADAERLQSMAKTWRKPRGAQNEYPSERLRPQSFFWAPAVGGSLS